MRKKNWLVLAAAAFLSIGVAFQSFAIEKLATPSGVKWSDTEEGSGQWNAVENSGGKYKVEMQRDGERIYNSSHSFGVTNKREVLKVIGLRNRITESGSYQFRVMAKGDGSDTEDSEWSEWTEEYIYTLPDIAFGQATDLKWDGTVATWKAPSDPASLQYKDSIAGYEVGLFADGEEKIYYICVDDLKQDFKEDMIHDAENYTFTVRVISRHPSKIAHGIDVDSENSIDLPDENQKIENQIDGLLSSETVGNAPETLSKDISKVQAAMQTDEKVREKIGALEQKYLTEKNITTETQVAEDVGMDAEAISVIGAGLNAKEPDSTVEFHVKKPAKEVLVDAYSYKNAVQVDFSLQGAVDKLKVPVMVTLPIPEGILPSRFAVLHYHQDGSFEEADPLVIDEDAGTASFVVTRFSVFVLAEKGSELPSVATPSNAEEVNKMVDALPESTIGMTEEEREAFGASMSKILAALKTKDIKVEDITEETVLKMDGLMEELFGGVNISWGDGITDLTGVYLAAGLYDQNDVMDIHVDVANVATSSNASRKLQFDVNITAEKGDGTIVKITKLKAPIILTVQVPEYYVENYKSSDKLSSPGGKKTAVTLEGDDLTVFVTKPGSYLISGSGSSGSGSHGARSAGKDPYTYRQNGTWLPEAAGWRYRYVDGTYAKNVWIDIPWNGAVNWYRFNEAGYVETGWFHDGVNWYYLHDVSDGNLGSMYQGWHQINGKWYYFSTREDGPRGAMLHDTTTPDGYRVGGDGVWVQN